MQDAIRSLSRIVIESICLPFGGYISLTLFSCSELWTQALKCQLNPQNYGIYN